MWISSGLGRRQRPSFADLLRDDLCQYFGHIVAGERSSPGQRLVQHGPNRQDVGALVDRLPFACSGAMEAAVPGTIPVSEAHRFEEQESSKTVRYRPVA